MHGAGSIFGVCKCKHMHAQAPVLVIQSICMLRSTYVPAVSDKVTLPSSYSVQLIHRQDFPWTNFMLRQDKSSVKS